jgi:hypothetical protein
LLLKEPDEAFAEGIFIILSFLTLYFDDNFDDEYEMHKMQIGKNHKICGRIRAEKIVL